MGSIQQFRGKNLFLSNFYDAPIIVDGILVPTVEHGYQMLKTLDPEERAWIAASSTPVIAKRRGKQVTMRSEWEEIKVDCMYKLLKLKFAPGSELAAKLIATGNAELVEGNRWGDRFWGVCGGTGQNMLGQLLMRVRSELT